jgi:diadenosine tetraphosphate (Ap4A) HIT family hydrolase
VLHARSRFSLYGGFLLYVEKIMIHCFDIDSPDMQRRVVAKNSLAFAFPSCMPIVPGHLLICPIRVVAKSELLTHTEWLAILDLKSTLCNALTKAFDAEGFNFAWNQGENAGQSVPHFHLHLVPRKKGDTGIWEYDPRVFLYRPGSRQISPHAELVEVAQHIKSFLLE